MEFFNKAGAVRLRSHLNKYLVADDDQHTVRQSRDGSSRKARWLVELVPANPHAVRLKGCHGRYLTASDDAFLLGMTGKRVVQSIPTSKKDNASIDWEPIKEGYKIKLRTKGGKFLRANGATPPWRNSITHDLPHRTATQDWVMWEIDIVDISVLDDHCYIPTATPTVSPPRSEDYSCPSSPAQSHRSSWRSSIGRRSSIAYSNQSSLTSGRQDGGMEFFHNAKSVRLQSHLGKYLIADDDEQTVCQRRDGASRNARWAVELVEDKSNRIRLKSCHGLYLTAADEPFLLGMTGKKVLQTLPEKKTDVSVEWQPVKEGSQVKLMTVNGKFLRGNGGSPPWRNSVTHDVPHRTATQSWVLWGVDVIDIWLSDPDQNSDTGSGSSSDSTGPGSPVVQHQQDSPKLSVNKSSEVLEDQREPMDEVRRSDSFKDDLPSSFHFRSSNDMPGHSHEDSLRKAEGRLIYYHVAEDEGEIDDEEWQEKSFQFKGHGVEELSRKLEEETGLEQIVVCLRNVLNGKLYPLRLSLPPNNTPMHVVVVPQTSSH